jgi:Tol biopolymer transport system component
VFVARLDGGDERNLSQSPAYDGWPVWSPDSEWVAFSSNREGAPRVGQVYMVRRNGAEMQPISSGPLSNVQPSFAPDGAAVLSASLFETAEREFSAISRWPLAISR